MKLKSIIALPLLLGTSIHFPISFASQDSVALGEMAPEVAHWHLTQAVQKNTLLPRIFARKPLS